MTNSTKQPVTKIETTVHIKRRIDDVYDFVTTPGNWPQWHPSSIAVTGDSDHSLEVGERVTEDFCVVWRRGQVVWTATGREAPFRWQIDGEIVGRDLGGTIQYQLSPDGEGTLFRRAFTYSAPTFLFAAVNKLIGRRRVQYESELASLRLKSLLETGNAAVHGSANSYYFLNEWILPGDVSEVWPIIANGADYPEWWGMVYEKVESMNGMKGAQVGAKAAVSAHGRLPYHIHFTSEITDLEPQRLLSLRATGDLTGEGTWRLTPIDGGTRVTFEWIVEADKPILRLLSPLVKPLLVDNHRWTMNQGEKALKALLSKREFNSGDITPPVAHHTFQTQNQH